VLEAIPLLASLPLALLAAVAPDPAIWVLPALLAIAVTISHGALDVYLLHRARALRQGAAYLGAVGLMAFCFFAAPAPALVVFLTVSMVHFADSDSMGSSGRAHAFERAWRGTAVLWLAATLQPNVTAAALGALASDPKLGSSLVALASHALADFFVLAALAAHTWSAPHWRARALIAAEFLVLAVWFALTPLIVAFAAYFCCVHGWRHLLRAHRDHALRAALEGAAGFSRLTSVLGISAAIAAALPMALATSSGRELVWTRDIFIVLASFAIPHAFVVHRWIGQLSK
jgi:Brp/Blh family beta-carotene 15,15'-monooxygenase